MYHRSNDTWTNVANIPGSHRYPGCGTATNPNARGKRILIVVSGWNDSPATHIFDPETLAWSTSAASLAGTTTLTAPTCMPYRYKEL